MTALQQVVQRAVNEPQWRPHRDQVPPLPKEHEAYLIKQFRMIPNVTNKLAIALVLGYGGGEESVSLLTLTLTNGCAGHTFSEPEAQSFLGLLQAIGYAAQRQSAAYDFLELACRAQFWEQATLPGTPDRVGFRRRLVQHSLLGLALSGSPAGLEFLEGLRSATGGEFPHGQRSAVVDAVFRYRMLERHGARYLSGEVFPDFESFMRAFRDWRATAEGAQWAAWSVSPDNRYPGSSR